jgi:glycosyltransferase involved in cell wall biosynthesis
MLSIIIPNKNSPVIHKTLDSLRHQTRDMSDVEVLVAGVDEPGLIVQDDLVQFIRTDRTTNAPTNRNVALRAARGDLFLFLDADCIAAPDWIERHLDRHRRGEQVVGGAVTFARGPYLTLADNLSAFHDLLSFTRPGPRPYLVTANMSVRREVVERAGLMDESLDRADDLDWMARFRALGYTLYFDPRAIIVHEPPRHTWREVMAHWTGDARDTLRVRLRYRHLLNTPRLAAFRSIFLWGAPAVAAWATARTFAHSGTWRYLHTLPVVYLTKLAWCWAAFWDFDETPGIFKVEFLETGARRQCAVSAAH